jgi:hypothetical protein
MVFTRPDIYFGLKALESKKQNSAQTVPGGGWFTVLRLYSPLQPWFDKSWRPGGDRADKTGSIRGARGLLRRE